MLQKSKRFSIKKQLRLLSITAPAILLGCSLAGGVFSIVMLFLSESTNSSAAVIDISFIVIRFVFPGFSVLMMIVSGVLIFQQVLPNFLSYLLVSEQGLEYNYWPYHHIRCSWEDVQEIAKRREVVLADVILLRNATEIGRSRTMAMRKKLGLDLQYFIPLNILDGWPTGELADILRQYAPHLFEVPSESVAVM